ncbi:MAG: septum formation initiator family protein [Myxococcota bacterium]|nr:septum formation initiator family protein [Myxococcota bacterium]
MRGLLGIALVLGLGLVSAALDEESGIRSWLHLRSELQEARARVAALRAETRRLNEEAEQLESGDFALERAIREELERVRPGQTLVRLRPGDVPSARIP